MKKISKPVVFFGSGPVAAESLRLLLEDTNVEAVITKPRPQGHRGEVPVLELAHASGLPVHTVATDKDLDVLVSSKKFKSRIAILIDFGIIVSQKTIDSFELGILNSHFSLLPELRGADPITFSILSGQEVTGVSLMLLTAGMDEGPLLASVPYVLPPKITTPELTRALIDLSNQLVHEYTPEYINGDLVPKPQDTSKPPTYSRKLEKQDGILDWSKAADRLEREIRAYIEWPKSRTTIAGKDIVITEAHVVKKVGTPGSIVVEDNTLIIYCGQDALAIDKLKPAGKKEMTTAAFLAGYGHLF